MKGSLSEDQVQNIFGPSLKATTANHLLRVLHGRRVAGTLEDPAFAVHTAQFSTSQINAALEYLRKKVPVDEVMNAGLRAEDELKALEVEEETAIEAAEKKTTAKTQKTDKAEVTETAAPEEDSVYGKSAFDQIRARNIAKNLSREKALKEEAERKRLQDEAEGRTGPVSLVEVGEGERAITNPIIAEYHKGATSDMEEAPEMSLWQRVGPTAVTTALILGFCISICMVYQEPSERYRLIQDISIEKATLGAVVLANVVIFLAWKVPPMWKFFNKYMLLVVGLPKPISVFTSIFSHQQLDHLVWNMVPLYLVGIYLHEDLGRATFLTLLLACGSVGFLGSLWTYAARGLVRVTTMGASGATLGLLSAWFWDHRDEGFKIMGLPDGGVHGIVYWGLLVGLHFAGVRSMFSTKDRIDLVSHMFGILAGTLGIEVINWCGMGREKKSKDDDASAPGAEKVTDLVTGKREVVVVTAKGSGN